MKSEGETKADRRCMGMRWRFLFSLGLSRQGTCAQGGSFLLNTKASSSGGLLLGVASGSSAAAWFASSYVQDGGHAKIGRLICGGERNACAAMAVAGGVLELPFLSQTQFKVGYMGYGIFQQLGGVVYVNTNNVQQTLDNRPAYAFEVGSGLSAA